MLELIVNQNKNVENIALVENGKLVEVYNSDDETKKRRLEGNIYAGEVGDIISGMQAAFIDFGESRNGFIHFKDVVPQLDAKQGMKLEEVDIKKVLKPKQKIMVQVKKDCDDKKGARLSTHICLAGKYMVLMPNTSIITISQKIEDEKIKNDLIKIIKDNIPENCGAIVRTSAQTTSSEEIIKEIEKLSKKWNNINKKFKTYKGKPTILYESENIVEKIILDLGTKKLEKITTNSSAEYSKIKKMLDSENLDINLVQEKNSNLLTKYELDSQIEKSTNRKIWLNCGGFITIDKTEALIAIDVNTGKFTGKKDLESTVFKVNKEATLEIAKQLRLRDIGGIIIIDYIDMKNKENKDKIEELLKEALKEDRAKTQVEGFTKLNLMEMTRKHICSHLNTHE